MLTSNHMLIQASALQGFSELVSELGGDPDWLLAQLDLNRATLLHSDYRIPVRDFAELLNISAAFLNTADFGLRLGTRQNFEVLGALGVLMQNCRNVKEAVEAAQSYMAFHNQAEVWLTKTSGENAILYRYDLIKNLPFARQYTELAFANCVTFFRLVLGSQLEGFRLNLSHAPVCEQTCYRELLGIPVHFNCEQDALIYPARLLQMSLSKTDTSKHSWAEKQISVYHSGYNVNVLDSVSVLIQQLLGTGNVGIAQIASLMHLHKRTLQRRLAQQGVCFKTLLVKIRMQSARWYLTCSDIDITLLSQILGYRDAANFSRAFRAAHGICPRQWRINDKSTLNP